MTSRFLIPGAALLLVATIACQEDSADTLPDPMDTGGVEADTGGDTQDAPAQDTAPDASTPDVPEDQGPPDLGPTECGEPVPPDRAAFNTLGPYPGTFRTTAGRFTVPTTRGDWVYEEEFNGNESYIFLQFTDDPRQSQELRDFLNLLVFDAGNDPVGEFAQMLRASPPNVHYFFQSLDSDAADDMARLEEIAASALERLDEDARCRWSSRLHFINVSGFTLGGWIRTVYQQSVWLWFAIDPFGQMRQVGIPYDFLAQRPRLTGLAHEAQLYDYELRRQIALDAAGPVTEVTLWDNEVVNRGNVDIVLPDAQEMSTYDTLEVDLKAYCRDLTDENCGEWDRKSHLYVCDIPAAEDNAFAGQACQPRVPGQAAVEEQLGLCAGTETSCRADEDCAEVACEGYVAPQEEIAEVPAETLACDCLDPFGETVERQHVCNAEGTGYNDCNCGCGVEIARWITTYGREGSWVTDISSFLPALARGGRARIRYEAGNAKQATMTFRLSNRGKGMRPVSMQRLWSGGRFNETYNTDREPIDFTVPEGAPRVEIATHITGHGWGVEIENCAEFCNHTHHFLVNGTDEYVKRHPMADNPTGCIEQIPNGVVPNQYGSWPFGRAGWCPGLDVKPWVADITSSVAPGSNQMTYRGLFQGGNYVPRPNPNPPGGFGANITMNAWLVVWETAP